MRNSGYTINLSLPKNHRSNSFDIMGYNTLDIVEDYDYYPVYNDHCEIEIEREVDMRDDDDEYVDPNEELYIVDEVYTVEPAPNALINKAEVDVKVKKIDLDYIVLTEDREVESQEEFDYMIRNSTTQFVFSEFNRDANFSYMVFDASQRGIAEDILSIGRGIILRLEQFVTIDVFGTYKVNNGGHYIIIRDGKVNYAELEANQALDLQKGDLYFYIGAEAFGFKCSLGVDKNGNFVFSQPFTKENSINEIAKIVDNATSQLIGKKVELVKKIGNVVSKIWRWFSPRKQEQQNSPVIELLDEDEFDVNDLD